METCTPSLLKKGTHMTPSFNCPACGAPIILNSEYEEKVPCAYCGNAVPVPEMLRPAGPRPVTWVEVVPPTSRQEKPSQPDKAPAIEDAYQPAQPQGQPSTGDTAKWVRILLIVLAVVFVVPTCIGIVGAMLGVLASVIAPLLAFIF